MFASIESQVETVSPCTDLPELGNTFQRIHRVIDQHARLLSEAAECLQQLEKCCEQRFVAEESSPIVCEVSDRAPWLKRNFAALAMQHDALRKHLSSLIRTLERSRSFPRSWDEFAEEFSFFERQLAVHERVERNIWQEVFCQDVGTKD